MNSIALLDELKNITNETLNRTRHFQKLDQAILQFKPSDDKWNTVQVIEHLNTYARYYFPIIQKAIKNSSTSAAENFTPGWLGEKFVKSMLPQAGIVKNKMKTFKNHRPPTGLDIEKVLGEFVIHQQQLIELLEAAKKKDIGKIKIPISIAKFIKIKLGDTFRFIIAHHQRHFVQIGNLLQNDFSQPIPFNPALC